MRDWTLVYLTLICLVSCHQAKHSGLATSRYSKSNNIFSRHHLARHLNYTITKKSNIEDASLLLDKMVHEPKNKRGFLANLASLLTDAELIANRKKTNVGLGSVPHLHQHISIPSKKDKLKKPENIKNDTRKEVSLTKELTSAVTASKNLTVNSTADNIDKVTNKTNNEVSKKEEVPDIDDINQAFKNSANSKDFAPIFAMFHGKIVPLGKLADSSFKKAHVDEGDKNYNVEERVRTHDVTGSKRSFNDEAKKLEDEKLNDENIENESSKLSKLQRYLTNLDGHVPPTSDGKDKKAVAKDDVVFPEEEQATPRSDLMSHVKGVVLDSGKIISVNNNHVDLPVEESSKENPAPENNDEKQKFFVSDDGTLNPLKNKGDMADAVSRDIKEAGGADGQKTVAISLDVLKDLLKKTDTKVSLAALLNKPAEQRSEATSSDDDDPGTIEDFAAGGLKSHNQYRSKHHSSALVWSDDLAAKAQKLAESLADKKTLEIAKDLEKEGYGENVAKVWATFKNAGEAATKMWYSQSDNYHFDDPHLDENTGQFAQVVWKDTKEIGMGVAKSIDDVNNKYVYVTALYRPPGNIEAKLRDNVLPTGNNTVDVYTTFFKRTGVTTDKDLTGNVKKSHVQNLPLVKRPKGEK